MTGATANVEASLRAIEDTDDSIHAWVVVDADGARRQADLVQQRRDAGAELPLAGRTVGVKDIIDVAGSPTGAGFAPFSGRIATSDAPAVTALRDAGAIIIGKTVTTQFAAGDPPVTLNPWNLLRTPGGSSSGSAAAVAARQVDLALGTQTAGSVLRPAALCGIVGFKPSFGWISMDGVLPYAYSLDTLGIHARSVPDLALVYDVLARPALPRAGGCVPTPAPRIGVWADALAQADEPMREATIDAIRALGAAGAAIFDATCPVSFKNLMAIHGVIMRAEAAAAHQALFQTHPDDYAPRLRSVIETAWAMPADAYPRALLVREHIREEISHWWSSFDLIAIPTSQGPATETVITGNPELQAVATLLGYPSITIPMGLDHDGLPLGIQLIGTHRGADVALLRAARWVEALMPRMPAPPHAASSASAG